MTRVELSAILSDLVHRHAITLEEARATLARFDSGDLTDLPVATPAEDSNRWVLALAMVLFFMKGNTHRPLSTDRRKRAQKLLRRRYEAEVSQLAAAVVAGATISEWYANMQTVISDYARTMAVAGAGTLPRTKVQKAVDDQLDEQWPYLTGFATEILARQQGERAMTEAAIAARSKLYGSVAYGAFWRGAEPDAGFGQIVYYRSLDTGSTCSPCSQAARNGPYLVGSSYPRPGEICLGGSRCRCTLEFVTDPEMYNQLTGQRAA